MKKIIGLLFIHILFLILIIANALIMGEKGTNNNVSLLIFISLNIIFCSVTYLIYKKYFSKIYLTIIYLSCSMWFLFPYFYGFDFNGQFFNDLLPFLTSLNFIIFIYLLIKTYYKNLNLK